MNNTTSDQPYGIWVLRIWLEPDSGAWRSVVQDTRTQAKHYFATRTALQLFLTETVLVEQHDQA